MNIKELPRMIDLSCVKTEITQAELDKMLSMARKYGFICCFAMPCYTKWLVEQLKDREDILVGGAVGFPSGADLTEAKVLTAKQQIAFGCDELDMVINVSALKNQHYDMVADDMKQVHEVAQGRPLKVILEVAYLTDYEIQKGAEMAVAAGASFVKTGTGWAPRPTTADHIKLIKNAIGTSARIKAAGGVRTLKDIEEMVEAGCSRFGIGVNSAANILREAGFEI